MRLLLAARVYLKRPIGQSVGRRFMQRCCVPRAAVDPPGGDSIVNAGLLATGG